MKLFARTFQFTIPTTKEHIYAFLDHLSGWQPNRNNWQQGRYRTYKVDVDDKQSILTSLTTSFVGSIPLAKIHIQLENNGQSDLYTAKVTAEFVWGVSVFIVFFALFFIAVFISDFNLWIKLSTFVLLCLVCYVTFLGIYRDRENLITDFRQIGNLS